MITKDEEMDLTNIGGGAAVEKFDIELKKVLKDIMDPNTDPKARRDIIIKVLFIPDENREIGDIAISSKSNLAGLKAHFSKAIFGRGPGGYMAKEFKTQRDLFADNNKVTPITGKEGDSEQ